MFRDQPAVEPLRAGARRRSSISGCRRRSRRCRACVAVVVHAHGRCFPGSTSTTGIFRQGATGEKDAKDFYIMSVSPEFFETMEIPVLRGRDFNERDVANPTASALINETAAQEVLPERRSDRPARRPVTRRKRADPRSSASSATPSTTACATRRRRRSTRRSAPGTRSLTVMVRTAGDPAAMTETVRTRAAADRSGCADDRHHDADRTDRRPVCAGAAVRARLFAVRRARAAAGLHRPVRLDVVQRVAAHQRDRHPHGARRPARRRGRHGAARVDDDGRDRRRQSAWPARWPAGDSSRACCSACRRPTSGRSARAIGADDDRCRSRPAICPRGAPRGSIRWSRFATSS